ncbi:UNVERIFIED_CONTAM: hypothetical protein GTU68_043697 [Idotea baltica]|nr:hypothetical protein [Idotea baltica]
MEADYVINDDAYSPEEISAYILKKVITDAEYRVGEKIRDVVITCPAYFGINEREATKRAGEIAGLNVCAVINEPTAAALTAQFNANNKESKVIVVFDLGGGTLDITMLEISPAKMKVIVTGGDQNMGGLNWDEKIVEFLINAVKAETEITNEDVLKDLITRIELEEVASKAKHSLTVRHQTTASFYFRGRRNYNITRQQFEEITAPLVDSAIQLMKDMLAQAAVKGYEYFDQVLLVGGSTKMPMIQERFENEFGVPVFFNDPEESVAKGAALYGQSLSFASEIKKRVANIMGIPSNMINIKGTDPKLIDSLSTQLAAENGMSSDMLKRGLIKISNVISKSFGVVAYNNENKEMQIYNLINRQSNIPIKIRQRFGTHAHNQKRVRISVCENLSDDTVIPMENGQLIGDAIIGNLPDDLPVGSFIEIDFSINKDGMLEVEGREAKSQQSVKIEIETLSVISKANTELAKRRLNSKIIA